METVGSQIVGGSQMNLSIYLECMDRNDNEGIKLQIRTVYVEKLEAASY